MKKGLILIVAMMLLCLVSCTKEEKPTSAEEPKTETTATMAEDSTATDSTNVEQMATETKKEDDTKTE